jgi:hypothetical protein
VSRDEYAPEGYPRGQKALAEQAKKRLDAQEPAAKKAEELLRKLEKDLGSSTLFGEADDVKNPNIIVVTREQVEEQIQKCLKILGLTLEEFDALPHGYQGRTLAGSHINMLRAMLEQEVEP